MNIIIVCTGWEHPRRNWERLPVKYLERRGHRVGLMTLLNTTVPFTPDIVFAVDPAVTWFAEEIAGMHGVPFVVQVLGTIPDDSTEGWGKVRQSLERANRIVAISKSAKNHFLMTYTPKCPITVCYQGVDDELAQQYQDQTKDNEFICIGPVERRKRIGLIVETAEKTNSKLVVIGEDPQGFFNEARAGITYLGMISDEEKFLQISKSKCFVSASEGEEFGLPMCEAAYFGVPSILPDRTERPDHWVDVFKELWEDAAFYYDGTLQELVKCMEYVKANPSEVKKKGQLAKEIVAEKQLTMSGYAEKLERVFLECFEVSNGNLVEWANLISLSTPEFFDISRQLWDIEDRLGMGHFVNYPRSVNWFRRFEYPWAILNAELKRSDIVLDAGGGENSFQFLLADKCKEVHNLDLFDWHPDVFPMVEGFVKAGQYSNIILKQGDLREIPYPDNFFDKVFCISVIEHIPENRIKAIDELLRVLKSGGLLILTLDVSPIKEPTIKEIESICNHLGLAIPEEPSDVLTSAMTDAGRRFSDHPVDNPLKVLCLRYRKGGNILEKKKLNIGSFTTMIPDFLNLDIIDLSDYAKQKGYQFQQVDVRQGLPFEDNSIYFINSSHLIEHLTVEEGIVFLKECKRVLKTNCSLRIGFPDLWEMTDAYQRGGMDSLDIIQIDKYKQSPSQADKFWQLLTEGHKTCYDAEALTYSLELAGFNDIRVVDYDEKLDMYPDISLYIEARDTVRVDMATVQVSETSRLVTTEIRDRISWIKQTIRELLPVVIPHCIPGIIVDIGCGHAPATVDMYDTRPVQWVDHRDYGELAKSCTDNGRPAPLKEKYTQAWAEELPFEDKEFALAVLGDLLEHVEDPVVVLREASRVAEKIILTVPNEHSWDESLEPFKNAGHKRFYTKELLEEHLKEAGIGRYQIDELNYGGWSFFTVIADSISAPNIIRQQDSLKIALISSPFFTVPPKGYGGMERVIYDIAVAMGEQGHDVTMFAPSGSEVEGCKVVSFGEPIYSVNVNWLEAEKNAIENCKQQILSDGFDIVHGHDWFGFEYMLKAQKPELKVCHTHHGGMVMDWWGRTKSPWPLNIFALSEWMKQVYTSQGMPSRVAHNGIDINKYSFKEAKGERLLFVGRASTFKQPHIAIEVAKRLNMPLDIVAGTFVDSEDYLEKVKALCDGKQIVWVQDPSQEYKVQLMQDAKCLLFPSKMGEPWGLVAAECAACGTPTVALRDGAIPEIVEHGVTGFVCDTVEEMCEAVKKVDGIAPDACRERVERLFSRKVAAEHYVSAYRDILKGDEW